MKCKFESKQVLFVWDGTPASVHIADRYLSTHGQSTVACVHVLPHESICAYSTPGYSDLPPSRLETRIRNSFEVSAKTTKLFAGKKLEIAFGDRINEILIHAKMCDARMILMPRFRQSRFSHWIHGDLNNRIVEKSGCSVVFYDSDGADQIITGHDRADRLNSVELKSSEME